MTGGATRVPASPSVHTSGAEPLAVKVALRIRPQTFNELDLGSQVCLRQVQNEPQVVLGLDRAFTFDHVLDSTCDQEQLYRTCVQPLVSQVLDGYNSTILAYGQTGSGKTYTMGSAAAVPPADGGDGIDGSSGIIPRAVAELFARIEAGDSGLEAASCEASASFFEIYKEEVFDLLRSRGTDSFAPLSVREDSSGTVSLPGLNHRRVGSVHETMQVLAEGAKNRMTGATAMNAVSSRSHAVLSVAIRLRLSNGKVLSPRLVFVDLAGSERVKRTGASGHRFSEGIQINKGLLCLGNVISALCEKQQHVPYRDSKLTRLLQESLGGNSHTLMVACVSPSDIDAEETLNTLKYANRARQIRNKILVMADPTQSRIAELTAKVTTLEAQLHEADAERQKLAAALAGLLEADAQRQKLAALLAKAHEREVRALRKKEEWTAAQLSRLESDHAKQAATLKRKHEQIAELEKRHKPEPKIDTATETDTETPPQPYPHPQLQPEPKSVPELKPKLKPKADPEPKIEPFLEADSPESAPQAIELEREPAQTEPEPEPEPEQAWPAWEPEASEWYPFEGAESNPSAGSYPFQTSTAHPFQTSTAHPFQTTGSDPFPGSNPFEAADSNPFGAADACVEPATPVREYKLADLFGSVRESLRKKARVTRDAEDLAAATSGSASATATASASEHEHASLVHLLAWMKNAMKHSREAEAAVEADALDTRFPFEKLGEQFLEMSAQMKKCTALISNLLPAIKAHLHLGSLCSLVDSPQEETEPRGAKLDFKENQAPN